MASRIASDSPSRKGAGPRRPFASRRPVGVESLEARNLLSTGISRPAAVVDPAPPRVVSAEFVFDGSSTSGKPAGIALTFNEGIVPSTLRDGTIRLWSRRLGPDGSLQSRPIRILNVSYDQSTNTATLTPDRRAFFPREARVAVLPGVTDLSGNATTGKEFVIIPRR